MNTDNYLSAYFFEQATDNVLFVSTFLSLLQKTNDAIR